MCILALCRACVCVFCMYVRAPLSNLSCVRNSVYTVYCVNTAHL